eukprot:TRINITY_DN22641_c0_g1_i1.p1 TRINITY_DN22641_c0_g1~~TRINITY_DN22641_c0_g1_i1.p1  ORF type:complete len:114 (-),score=24.00 TRINITY_DN22641_c0_g1_i1:13-333(-)
MTIASRRTAVLAGSITINNLDYQSAEDIENRTSKYELALLEHKITSRAEALQDWHLDARQHCYDVTQHALTEEQGTFSRSKKRKRGDEIVDTTDEHLRQKKKPKKL